MRAADPGPGKVIFDILAPDGIGARTTTFTLRPARTVEAPGTTQALRRSSLVPVTVAGDAGRAPRTGRVRRPRVLGALIAKAAATTIAVRSNPERDYEDAATMLCLLADPLAARDECKPKDRQRLRRLNVLADERHPAWVGHGAGRAARGRDALNFLID